MLVEKLSLMIHSTFTNWCISIYVSKYISIYVYVLNVTKFFSYIGIRVYHENG